MRCIVTAGPTYEPLDEVRRLTNFSTGRLGGALADHLTNAGHEVLVLRGASATAPLPTNATDVQSFGSTADLRTRFENLSEQKWDAVFHAAAVSDFAFGKVFVRTLNGELMPIHDPTDGHRAGECRKLSTREGSLLAELLPTPKLLPMLRGWFPQALLVGWKYEMDGSRAQALDRGREQLRDARTDACVVNGAAYGEGFGLLEATGALQHLADLSQLCRALEALLRGKA